MPTFSLFGVSLDFTFMHFSESGVFSSELRDHPNAFGLRFQRVLTCTLKAFRGIYFFITPSWHKTEQSNVSSGKGKARK